MNIDDLKAKEARLWAEVQALQKPLTVKENEWLAVRNQLTTLIEREKLRAELLAELEKERATA